MTRKWIAGVAMALGVSVFTPDPAAGQVKQVEMNIAGYLCGF